MPKDEERIFMFLDLKASTTIAEKIGHRRYFDFMSDFITDATTPILNNHGEIYQYVGDEIVISWRMDKGEFDPHCIQCFFDIKNQIDQLSAKYLAKFDVVPEFKAGLHYGNVTVGEVGVIKKELIFSGDAVNTTAHIRTKCNEYGAELLISTNLAEKLNTEAYEIKQLGDIRLKGKQTLVELNSVHLTVSSNPIESLQGRINVGTVASFSNSKEKSFRNIFNKVSSPHESNCMYKIWTTLRSSAAGS